MEDERTSTGDMYYATGIMALAVAVFCFVISLIASSIIFGFPSGIAVLFLGSGMIQARKDAVTGGWVSFTGAAVCAVMLVGVGLELCTIPPIAVKPILMFVTLAIVLVVSLHPVAVVSNHRARRAQKRTLWRS